MAVVTEKPEVQPPPPRRPREFTPEEASKGGKAGAGKPSMPQPSELLKDMRLVYKGKTQGMTTPGQKGLIDLLKSEPEKFMAQLGTLERARQAARKSLASPAHTDQAKAAEKKAVADEGTRRVGELLDDLLAEWSPQEITARADDYAEQIRQRKKAVGAEREACALLAASQPEIAAAIRARGE